MRGVKQYGAIATGYVDIPEDGVYYFTTNNDEVWIDGKLLISNEGEVKRFSRNDKSVALAKGLHELKVVFLGHIIGGLHCGMMLLSQSARQIRRNSLLSSLNNYSINNK